MKLTHQQLRQFMQTTLNDTQLRTFVLDHFPALYSQISAWGQSYTDRVLLLIDYCYRLEMTEELAVLLAQEFEDQLAHFARRFEVDEIPSTGEPGVETGRLDVPPPDRWGSEIDS